MTFFKLVLTAALLFLISPETHAGTIAIGGGEFHLRLLQTPTAQIVELSGIFTNGSQKRAAPLFSALEPSKPLILNLDFGGGQSSSIEPFAKALRRWAEANNSRIITLVLDNRECASYCLMLFMTGDERVAYPAAKFGFHTAYAEFAGVRLKFPGAMIGNYAQFGIDPSWLLANRDAFQKLEVKWYAPSQLEGSQILTRTLTYDDSVESLTAPEPM